MQSKEVSEFINQFPKQDQQTFHKLVDKLIFIPNSELHRFYRNSILEILKKEQHKIAAFPLEKKFFRLNEEIKRDDILFRKNYDSSAVIGRILNDIERELGSKKILVNPTPSTLKAEKIKTYIFVEDLVGSGKRINDIWVKYPTNLIRTLKSLISYGDCNSYLISYGMTNQGLKALKRSSKAKFKDILYARFSNSIYDYLDEDSVDKVETYPGGIGFQDTFIPIIFEHGCHNCLPPILWSEHSKWNPLFPSRSIPPHIADYFRNKNKLFDQIATSLFDKNLVKIPLALNDLKSLSTYEKIYIIPILALKSKGYTDRKILSLLLLEIDIFDKCLLELKFLALINRQHQLTDNGMNFLSNLDKKYQKKLKDIPGYINNDIYIPSQFRNFKPKT